MARCWSKAHRRTWRATPPCAAPISARPAMAELLVVDNLVAGYGEAVVLDRVSFSLAEGKALALLGRNGAGKTTLIETLVGLTTWRSGTIRLADHDIARLAPERRARAGIGWVPQERGI